MSPLGNPAGLDVRFPQSICNNQGDFWVYAKDFQRSIRTRVVIGDYGIDVRADVVQRVTFPAELDRLVATPYRTFAVA